ncbi:MAG: hypothetical protein GXY38_02030 [Planctomycetes bacterium]|nr:hypothetical protein [Planctomycetota bacterium]
MPHCWDAGNEGPQNTFFTGRLLSDMLGAAAVRDGIVIDANEQFLKMTRRRRRDMLAGGITLKGLTPPEYDLILARELNSLWLNGHCLPFEMEFVLPEAGRAPVVVGPSLVPEHADVFVFFALDISGQKKAEADLQKAHDDLEANVRSRTAELARTVQKMQQEIAKRKRAEKSLRRQSNQLRELTSELTLAEHRERRRIAGVLHDSVQQLLAGASFRASLLAKNSVADVPKAAEEICELLSGAIKVSRTLTGELCPPILPDRGLIGAMQWLNQWMYDKFRLTVDMVLPEPMNVNPPDDMSILLFQSVRELLFNVAKHAKTSVARLEVKLFKRSLRIVVSDRGRGFNPRHLRSRQKHTGLGLFSISERLAVLGGSMKIKSTPGKGSSFVLSVPMCGNVTAANQNCNPLSGMYAPQPKTHTLKIPCNHHLHGVSPGPH